MGTQKRSGMNIYLTDEERKMVKELQELLAAGSQRQTIMQAVKLALKKERRK